MPDDLVLKVKLAVLKVMKYKGTTATSNSVPKLPFLILKIVRDKTKVVASNPVPKMKLKVSKFTKVRLKFTLIVYFKKPSLRFSRI